MKHQAIEVKLRSEFMNVLNVVLSGIVTALLSLMTIKNFSKEELNVKKVLIYLSVYTVFLIISCFHFSGISRLLLNIIIMITSLYFSLFKKNISDSVYYTIVYNVFAAFFEVLLSLIFVGLLKFDINVYENFSFSLLVFSICNCLSVFFISKIKPLDKALQKFNRIISKNNKDWIYIIICIILVVLLITFNEYNLKSNVEFYINIFITIFMFISIIYVVYNKIQKSAYENKYNEVMEYVTRYEKIINEQGKKNHEYNNQLMVLKGYLDKPDRLKDYLELIIGEHKTGQNYTVKQLGFLPDGGIKGLLYHKLSKMEEEGIKPYLYVDQSMQELSEDIFDIKTCQDITKILGVFIDNAIDASSKAEQKEVEIDFKVQKDCLIISVANTYDNKTDVNKIGKKGYSTKGAGHGFGLSIVKDISKNNPNIESFSDISDNKFKQTVLIYYKK